MTLWSKLTKIATLGFEPWVDRLGSEETTNTGQVNRHVRTCNHLSFMTQRLYFEDFFFLPEINCVKHLLPFQEK